MRRLGLKGGDRRASKKRGLRGGLGLREMVGGVRVKDSSLIEVDGSSFRSRKFLIGHSDEVEVVGGGWGSWMI